MTLPDQIVELFRAHAWFPLSVVLVPLFLRVLKLKESGIYATLPQWLKWLPAFLTVFGTAFVAQAATGSGAYASLVGGVIAAFVGTPAALGTFHAVKTAREPKKLNLNKSASRGVARVGLMVCLGLSTGLGASAVMLAGCAPGAWVPVASAALSAAGQFLSYVSDFVSQVRQTSAAALIPDDFWTKYEDAMSRARYALTLMNRSVQQGEKAEGAFWMHLEEFKAIGRELLDLFDGVGFLQRHGTDAGTLKVPDSVVPLKANGETEPLPGPVNVELPTR